MLQLENSIKYFFVVLKLLLQASGEEVKLSSPFLCIIILRVTALGWFRDFEVLVDCVSWVNETQQHAVNHKVRTRGCLLCLRTKQVKVHTASI